MHGQKLFQPSRTARNGSSRHGVQNILFITSLFWCFPVRTVLETQVLFRRVRDEILIAVKFNLAQLFEQSYRKGYARIVRNRSFDHTVTLPIDPDPVFHDLNRGVETLSMNFDVTIDCPKRLDGGFD